MTKKTQNGGKAAKSEKAQKKPTGRPVTPIDPKVVEGMAYAGGTTTEIAQFLGVSTDTIDRRFSDVLTQARARRRLRLRQLQWKAAEGGDKAMLIWLGKVELGQMETVRSEHTGKDGAPIEVANLTPEQREARVIALLRKAEKRR